MFPVAGLLAADKTFTHTGRAASKEVEGTDAFVVSTATQPEGSSAECDWTAYAHRQSEKVEVYLYNSMEQKRKNQRLVCATRPEDLV